MLFAGKITQKTPRRLNAGAHGFLLCREVTVEGLLAIDVQARAPFTTGRLKRHTLDARRIVATQCLVRHVLGDGGQSEIFDPVVGANAVAMVEMTARPFAIVMHPGQPMREDVAKAAECGPNTDHDVTKACHAPSGAPGEPVVPSFVSGNIWPRPDGACPPRQYARRGVVIEKLSNPGWGQNVNGVFQSAVFHGRDISDWNDRTQAGDKRFLWKNPA